MSQKPRQKRKKGFEAKEGERASRRSKTRRDLSNFGVVDGDADLGEQDDGVVEGGGVGQAGLGRGGGSLLAATEGAVQAGAGDEVGVKFISAVRPGQSARPMSLSAFQSSSHSLDGTAGV